MISNNQSTSQVENVNTPLSVLDASSTTPVQLPEELNSEFETLDDAIKGLGLLEKLFVSYKDRRAIFVTAYLTITRALKTKVSEGFFLDNQWATRYGLAFANLYRVALLAYEKGETTPKAWQVSFDTAKEQSGLLIQDLVLGINAHINHDLPFALTQVKIDPDRSNRYRDHTSINQMLDEATSLFKDRVCEMYAPALSIVDHAISPVEDAFTSFSIAKARDAAWTHAVNITNANSDTEREAIIQNIDDTAGILAHLIMAPAIAIPAPLRTTFIDALHHLEEATPWWMFIVLPEDTAGGEAPAPILAEPLMVGSLAELDSQLEKIIANLDNQHNKLAVYPTAYQFFVHTLEQEIDLKSNFENPEWVTALVLHHGGHFLKVIEAISIAGTLDKTACWQSVFTLIRTSKLTVIQVLTVAALAHLEFDLPVALLRTGISDPASLDSCKRDYAKFCSLFVSEVKSVETKLILKYGQFLKYAEIVSQHFEEMMFDFDYARVLEGAWENAQSLSFSGSEQERQQLLNELDNRVNVLVQGIGLRGLPGINWIVDLIHHIENNASESWSSFVGKKGN